MQDQQTREKRSSMALIWLCWLVYSCSYIGKVNYSANINLIQEYFAIDDYLTVGFAGTLFFFAYGIGQIVNGIWCKKYNIKWMIFLSLLISGTINLIIPLLPTFAPIKYLWVINGFSMSVLWPTLIRFLSERLSKKYMAKASVIMGTTVAVGTFFVYGTSAVYALFTTFKAAFYTAAAVLIGVALIWIIALDKLDFCSDENQSVAVDAPTQLSADVPVGAVDKKAIYLVICTLAICGVATNLIKDGLSTWVPAILKSMYGLDNSLSIILTLALPLVSIFGNAFAVSVHKRMHDFVHQCAVMFFISGILIITVIGGVSLNMVAIMLVGFAAVSLLISSCNSLITSIFPLFIKGKVNSGLIAGVLNGFCYLGSTLSTYVLGSIADNHGWLTVFWTLLAVCAVISLLGLIYSLVRKYVIGAGFAQRKD
ncbi:MAG: MFS transporter [Clostridia bacterium]|nr:MFS transporter [Clostridia bacterium]